MSRPLILTVLCGAVLLVASASASAAHMEGTARSQSAHGASVAQPFGLFRWRRMRRADHYQFQLAADRHFNSLVLPGNGNLLTRNTWATLPKVVADGRYWWRVRGISAGGNVTRWHIGTATKRWTASPQLLGPAAGAAVAFPSQPLLLAWSPVLGAAKYEVAIATDSQLSSLVGGRTVLTSATAYIPPVTLQQGTYYWAVTPVDAEGHEGVRSAVRSFSWGWNSATSPTLTDLISEPPFFDPLLTWTQVPGASHYEVDVNFSQDFDPGSKVCCSTATLATAYSPTAILPNNTYYWRVRAVNAQGGEGAWTPTQTFTQTFDNVPPITGSSIAGLHMRDDLGDAGPEPDGWSTPSPILVWNAVPGASAYNVEVVPYTGGSCEWTAPPAQHWNDQTAATAWTPLGSQLHATPPYPAGTPGVSADGPVLAAGAQYCARVRAIGDTTAGGQRIYGDFTYLPDAFTYAPSAASGTVAAPASSDYLSPTGGVTVGQTPLFTWKPIAGANSYWVIVARDPSFTTIVDYALTNVPAYAPRHLTLPETYADETTAYYWAVLPAGGANGSSPSVSDPSQAVSASFNKLSTPPTLLSPSNDQALPATQPVFRWTPVSGARNYRIQVSTDPNFGTTFLDNVVTSSTAYVSNTVYPAQATLYWRVQADDEDNIPLTWSATGTFKQVLPAPAPIAGPSQSDGIQPLRWSPVSGAVGYDVLVTLPSGQTQTFSNIPTPAAVPLDLRGAGFFRWQVRAEFPTAASGTVAGPYSAAVSFTRTVTAPAGERATIRSRSLLLRWKGRPGIASYHVEISTRPDFSRIVDAETTELPMLAPSFYNQYGWSKAKRFYWHVAAVDADGNVGNFGPTRRFRLRAPRGA